jgi:hypothetical protein
MSIKKEVKQLTEVYQGLLKENINEVNIGYDPSASPNIQNMNPTSDCGCDEGGENMMPISPAPMSPPEDDGYDNVSMAKTEVFKIYKYACDLQKLLTASCDTKVEPWQLSKLTKAADYLCSVTGSLEYDEFEKMHNELKQGMSDMAGPSPLVVRIREMLASEPIEVNEEVLKQAIFNIECLKESKR